VRSRALRGVSLRLSGLRESRPVWVLALAAVAALVIGSAASAVVLATQNGDASSPVEAGPITVPVERRVVTNEIRTRGTAVFADAFDVVIDASLLGGSATVSGRVPGAGEEVSAGSVVLEIAGRPVIALPGDVPSYRTMRIGSSGGDVSALKAALAGLGIDPGDQGSAAFDEATARAVAELYARVGYEPPRPEEGADEAVAAAEAAVRSADIEVLSAERELNAVRAGAPASERAALDGAVATAEAALTAARASGAAPEVAAAEAELSAARARRDEALRPADDRVEVAALAAARAAVDDARSRRARARADAQTFLPAAEVAFIPQLPRRVDAVEAVRGRPVEGTVLTVSGATLAVEGEVIAADAALIAEGSAVTMTREDGTELPGTITALGRAAEGGSPGEAGAEGEGVSEEAPDQTSGGAEGAGSTGTVAFSVTPTGDPSALTSLAGQNVRVTIPVESTDGEVWAVPVAAVSTGPDGEARIEIVAAEGAAPELVTVELGLAAQGYVEVVSSEVELRQGLRVVVGE
jgi:hypothetical protein